MNTLAVTVLVIIGLANDVLTGSINLQGQNVTSQLTLGQYTLVLNAALTDGGPEGEFSVANPGRFGVALSRSDATGTSPLNLAACAAVGPQAISITAARGSGAQFQFTPADSDPAACVLPPATVAGRIMDRLITMSQVAPSEAGTSVQDAVLELLRRLFILALIGGVMLLAAPGLATSLSGTARIAPWSRLGLGLCLFIALPVLSVLVFIMGLSSGLWWLGLLMLALYACLLAASWALAGMTFGVWSAKHVPTRRVPPVGACAAGLVVLAMLGLLPIMGDLVNLVALSYGLGALMLAPRTAAPTKLVAEPITASANGAAATGATLSPFADDTPVHAPAEAGVNPVPGDTPG